MATAQLPSAPKKQCYSDIVSIFNDYINVEFFNDLFIPQHVASGHFVLQKWLKLQKYFQIIEMFLKQKDWIFLNKYRFFFAEIKTFGLEIIFWVHKKYSKIHIQSNKQVLIDLRPT